MGKLWGKLFKNQGKWKKEGLKKKQTNKKQKNQPEEREIKARS